MSLSPEICRRIVHFMPRPPASNHSDLHSLTLTCRAFQRETEPKLYEFLTFFDPARALLACETLVRSPRGALLASYAQGFWFTLETSSSSSSSAGTGARRHAANLQMLTPAFWTRVRQALVRMVNLKQLILYDPVFANSWVLAPSHVDGADSDSDMGDAPEERTGFRFQLAEARLRFTWDEHIVRFLESQNQLATLQIFDQLDDLNRRHVVSPDSLPELRVFDGTFMIGMQLFVRDAVAGAARVAPDAGRLRKNRMTNVQLCVDREVLVGLGVQRFLDVVHVGLDRGGRMLKGLSILDLPEEVVNRFLEIVALKCEHVRHLGLLMLPMVNRHKFYKSLMQLQNLRSIHLDVTRWNPHAALPAQRALAAELKTYRPTLRQVVFWIQATKFRWTYIVRASPGTDVNTNSAIGEWHSQIDPHQYPQYDLTWSSA